MKNVSNLFFNGLINNLTITALASIIPLIIGIVAYRVIDINPNLNCFLKFAGSIFESFCPVITIIILYFCVLSSLNNAYWICVIGFSISFIGYLPSRYNPENSFNKNIIVIFFGLIISIFKWSFVVSLVGVLDMLRSANLQMSKTYDASCFWLVFIASFVILILLNVVKTIFDKRLN